MFDVSEQIECTVQKNKKKEVKIKKMKKIVGQ